MSLPYGRNRSARNPLTTWISRWLGTSARPDPSHRRRLRLLGLEERIVPAFSEFVDPHPAAGNQFGATVVALSTGNVVVTSSFDDAGGTDAGAVYLFSGATGTLISTLIGSHAGDNIGSKGVTVLTNGNYVVLSPSWDSGVASNVGAVTWGSGATGVTGIVSSANSLVGSTGNDSVGTEGIIALTNGSYVVRSTNWDNGAATNAGAVTWGSGTTGVSGVVSSTNSLVGSKTNDSVGFLSTSFAGVIALSNGNYVVSSPTWDNGAVVNAGAVTWGNGTAGVSGTINAANSLVGTKANDSVGFISTAFPSVIALSNGNYVICSPNWDNGAVANAGAATWANGATGIIGTINVGNSLIGSKNGDNVGTSVTALTNGNYLVSSPNWDNGAVADVGAVTWGSGVVGVSGPVSAANSLVGSTASDQVGFVALTALSNGNYVVRTLSWDNGAVADVGAVTWGNGSVGISGVVSAVNSLVGSKANDGIGNAGVTELSNGNFVVRSYWWDNGAIVDAGAVTWGSGTAGVSGIVSMANSLVGSTLNDQVGGSGVSVLSNGNYVVRSPVWDNGSIVDAGAATWGNGTTGVIGVVTPANSLVGSTAKDQVGGNGVTALSNGNYVVISLAWHNGAFANAGAVTWGSGTAGVSGVVSVSNSLVGSTGNDSIGNFGVKPLSNGNYVVTSSYWDNGAVVDAGAVTWGSGTVGVSGVISAANSLVGSQTFDIVGYGGVIALTNGNYVVWSAGWDNGAVVNAGAATWGNGLTGISGVVSATNSLVGSSTDDGVGTMTALANGNYLVTCPSWDNGVMANAGAVTWASGRVGVTGVISTANSIIGSVADSFLSTPIGLDTVNGTFISSFQADVGGRVRVGSQLTGFGTGTVSAQIVGNDLVITDIYVPGKANNWNISFDGLKYIISDPVEEFAFAPSFAKLTNGKKTMEIGGLSLSGKIIFNGYGDSDVLTVDWSTGNIPNDIEFNSGIGDSDQFVIKGGSFSSATVSLTTTHDEVIVMDPSGADPARTFTLTGRQPLDLRGTTIDDLTFTLSATASDAYLEDDGTTSDGYSDLVSGNGTFATTYFANPANSLTINRGNAADSITITAVPDFNRTLTLGSSGSPFSSVKFGDAMTLTGASTLSAFSSSGISLAGNVKTNTGAITLTSAGAIAQTMGTVKTAGTLTLAAASGQTATFDSIGNSATSLVIPAGAIFLINGSFDSSGAVQVDGTMGGSGSVGTVTVTGTGKIVPGNSAGTLTTGNMVLNTGSIFSVEINGPNAGFDLDQLAVFGTVDLGGATLQGTLGFTPVSNQVFKVIDNNGSSDAVIGTFNGLAEGATVAIGSVNFTVSYVGGDGNDVTLTAPTLATSPPPIVTGVVFGDGTNQRSTVRQIVVGFSEPVAFSTAVANAFTVHRTGTNGTIGDVTISTNPVSGPTSSVTITFSGGLTQSAGSLVDGLYNLTIDASQVTGMDGNLDGDLVGGAGGNYVVIGTVANRFYRLFGDHSGDGTVNQNDFNALRLATLAGPSTVFDFDNDGQVGQLDYNAFRLRFLTGP